MFEPVDHPALAYLWLKGLMATAAGHPLTMPSGMGIASAVTRVEDPARQFQAIQITRQREYKTWRGLDVRHIYPQQGQEFMRFDVFSALEAGWHLLSQEMLDFVTLRDVPTAKSKSAALSAKDFNAYACCSCANAQTDWGRK